MSQGSTLTISLDSHDSRDSFDSCEHSNIQRFEFLVPSFCLTFRHFLFLHLILATQNNLTIIKVFYLFSTFYQNIKRPHKHDYFNIVYKIDFPPMVKSLIYPPRCLVFPCYQGRACKLMSRHLFTLQYQSCFHKKNVKCF